MTTFVLISPHSLQAVGLNAAAATRELNAPNRPTSWIQSPLVATWLTGVAQLHVCALRGAPCQ